MRNRVSVSIISTTCALQHAVVCWVTTDGQDHEDLALLLDNGFLLLEVDLDVGLVHQGCLPCVVLDMPQARVGGDIGEDLVDGRLYSIRLCHHHKGHICLLVPDSPPL